MTRLASIAAALFLIACPFGRPAYFEAPGRFEYEVDLDLARACGWASAAVDDEVALQELAGRIQDRVAAKLGLDIQSTTPGPGRIEFAVPADLDQEQRRALHRVIALAGVLEFRLEARPEEVPSVEEASRSDRLRDFSSHAPLAQETHWRSVRGTSQRAWPRVKVGAFASSSSATGFWTNTG